MIFLEAASKWFKLRRSRNKKIKNKGHMFLTKKADKKKVLKFTEMTGSRQPD